MSEPRPTAQHIQELEAHIVSLVNSLQRGELPVGLKPVRYIVDRILIHQLPHLELPVDKFIALYNDVPNVLNAYAITVNLTDISYNKNDRQQAVFCRHPKGNYWAIMFKPDRGWLVPNPDRQTDSIRSLPFAFDVQPPATLILPALIRLLPTEPPTWQVTQHGQLGAAQNTVIKSNHSSTFAIEAEVKLLRQELQTAIANLTAKDHSLDNRMNGFKQALIDLTSNLGR